jgi:hypothetical protein
MWKAQVAASATIAAAPLTARNRDDRVPGTGHSVEALVELRSYLEIPRYIFDVTNGHCVIDSTGLDCMTKKHWLNLLQNEITRWSAREMR